MNKNQITLIIKYKNVKDESIFFSAIHIPKRNIGLDFDFILEQILDFVWRSKGKGLKYPKQRITRLRHVVAYHDEALCSADMVGPLFSELIKGERQIIDFQVLDFDARGNRKELDLYLRNGDRLEQSDLFSLYLKQKIKDNRYYYHLKHCLS
jgi:hypothetical protein